MIRINLLPIRQTRKLEAARRELLVALLGGAVVLAACLGGWTLLTVRLDGMRDDNVALQKEVERLTAEVQRVDELETFKAELERKLLVIDNLRDRKSGPVHMLDDLAMALPERLTLTALDEKDDQVKIEGYSVTNEVISQFLRALEASPYFEQVFLQDIEAKALDGVPDVQLKHFELTARLSDPAKAEAAATAGGAAPGAAAGADAPAGASATPAVAPAPAGAPAPAAGAGGASSSSPAGAPPSAPVAPAAGGGK